MAYEELFNLLIFDVCSPIDYIGYLFLFPIGSIGISLIHEIFFHNKSSFLPVEASVISKEHSIFFHKVNTCLFIFFNSRGILGMFHRKIQVVDCINELYTYVFDNQQVHKQTEEMELIH